MKKEDETDLLWKEYRNSVCENQNKSQDDFEKYINLISSGALGLTVTFIDKIIPIEKAIYLWIIAIGWILLAITLLVNLYSHYQSAKFSGKTLSHIDNQDYNSVEKITEKCNKIINRYNKASIWSLFVGIIAIILFVIINIDNMNDKTTPKKPNQEQPIPATEERGRLIPPPPKDKPTKNKK